MAVCAPTPFERSAAIGLAALGPRLPFEVYANERERARGQSGLLGQTARALFNRVGAHDAIQLARDLAALRGPVLGCLEFARFLSIQLISIALLGRIRMHLACAVAALIDGASHCSGRHFHAFEARLPRAVRTPVPAS